MTRGYAIGIQHARVLRWTRALEFRYYIIASEDIDFHALLIYTFER